MSTRRDHPGFTLIEMIVSLTIIAAIMSMVYGSYAATTRSMDASGARMACEERACFALRLMARQLRCAYAPSSWSGSGDSAMSRATLDKTTGAASTPGALFRGDGGDPRGDILSFISSAGTAAGPNAACGLCRVTYRYDRAAATLAVSRENYNGPRGNRQSLGGFDTVLRNVASMELRFHDGQQWHETWDFRQRHVLPRAVNVRIVVTDEGGRPHHLATTVPIIEQVRIESESTRRAVAAGQL
jgi:type II secretion system protein J